MPSPRAPVAYLIVPAITLLVAVTLLLAVATPRTLIAVRVWGGPTARGPQSLRVQCVRRAVGVEDGVPLDGLEVEVDGAVAQASCGADGQGEVAVAPGREGSLPVRVRRGPETLAQGEARVTGAEWAEGALVFPAAVRGGGGLPLRAQVAGGTLLLERWSEVILLAPDELRAPGALKISGPGLEIEPPRPHPLGLRLRLRPIFFNASLIVEPARPEPGQTPWEARLPVAMSGVAAEQLALADGKLRGHLRTPTSQAAAYVRVQDQRGRLAAARVPLRPDGRGGAHAPFELALPPVTGPAWLVTSTGPQPSDASLPWPLTPDADPPDGRVVPDRLWVDGVEPAMRKEAQRLSGRLGAVGAVVLAGALLEALLLYERARAARLEFQRRMAEAGEGDRTAGLEERGGSLRVAMALALVLFGFAVVGALLVGRIG